MSSDEWKKKNTTLLMLRVINYTGIPKALDAYAESLSISRSECLRKILIEKLIEEGFLLEKTESD